MNRFLTRLGWASLILLVLLLAGIMVARVLFTRYLHSDGFRHALGEGAANALHASNADFSPLEFDGALVYGENFHAERQDGGGFSSMSADQLRATFNWHGLLHHTVQIDELGIQRLNVEAPVKSGVEMTEGTPGASETPAALSEGKTGWTVDLRKAVITEANWHWSDDPAGGLTGTTLTLKPDGQNGWVINAQGGTVRQAGWPSLDLESASMRWQSPTLYINSSTLRNGAGELTVTGAVATRQSVDLQVKLNGVDVQPVLTQDWRERLAGSLTGQANVRAPLGSDAAREITVSGSLALINGRLTALPILDQIGVFTHTERFRQLDLTRASADFTRTPEKLEIRNMVVEAEGLIRVEGSYTVENGEIAGIFEVGLTSATLQWIPGSQEQIFTTSRDGYRWTEMKLSGPVAHPVDDLTPRLVAAAGNAVIQGATGVEGAVKKAAQSALDLLLH
jgi:hypothetical protein